MVYLNQQDAVPLLKIFRINDPYRLIAAFVLLVVIRIPYWIYGPEILAPELQWMVVGERMGKGFVMYYEIWDYISPLSAVVYWFIDLAFGRSVIAYQVLALLVSFAQVVIFNSLAFRNKLYPENSYIPALVYTVLISFSYDFFTLSPVLMGTTFVLLSLNHVISQIEFRAKRDEKLLNIGLYLGLAALFHFPLVILGPVMIIVLLLFSSTIPRRFLMILYGWLVPVAFTLLFYFMSGNLEFYWINQVAAWFRVAHNDVIDGNRLLLALAPMLVFLLLALLRIAKRARLNNYQSRIIQVMLASIVLSTSVLLLEIDRYVFALALFVPWIAYFISFYFVLARRSFFAEAMFVVFLTCTVGNSLYFQLTGDFDMTGYMVPGQSNIEGERIAILAQDKGAYLVSEPATPFVNWSLSQVAWDNINRYRYLALTVQSIQEEQPERIHDPDGYFRKLLDRAPMLRNMYEFDGQQTYLLNN